MFIVLNGIPYSFNDAMSFKIAQKSETGTWLLYVQLAVNAELNQGLTLIEMPAEFFKDLGNDVQTSYFGTWQETLRAQQMLENQDYNSAIDLLVPLWEHKNQIIPLIQLTIAGDLLFARCLVDPQNPQNQELWKFCNKQKSFKQKLLGNLRVKAAYLALIENDVPAAEQLMNSADQFISPSRGEKIFEEKLISAIKNA
ncbi:hypothetical protein XA3_20400 [Xylocopilactobacillus apicola]|uniref:Uncharacterized protein n=2 Tax=Xylocopilactobacillus apicola TaxID=2932184 RepID=A0AAU9DTV2_9LACO|nr:hypothetical protein XA3_20400 [Xylocopilactobacillus apicola]